jgi:hypothetical protein
VAGRRRTLIAKIGEAANSSRCIREVEFISFFRAYVRVNQNHIGGKEDSITRENFFQKKRLSGYKKVKRSKSSRAAADKMTAVMGRGIAFLSFRIIK